MFRVPAMHSPEESVYDALMDVRFEICFGSDSRAKVFCRENAFGAWLAASGQKDNLAANPKRVRRLVNNFAAACRPFGIHLTANDCRAILEDYFDSTAIQP